VILAVLVRGETLTPLQTLGAAIATGGVILAGIVSEGGWRQTRIAGRGVVFGLIATLCFAVLTVGLAGPIRSAGWLPVLFASRLANAATVWLLMAAILASRSPVAAPLLATSLPPTRAARRRGIVVAMLGGLLDIAGFVAFAIGLELAPTWIVGLASSFGPIVSVIVAVVFWGERLRPTQWLGIAGIGVGLVAVALP